ncbi:hypothetical protein [Dysgonomonas sp. 511]|uniref:hypothetical protein n=1 Tax=Dysgonomonas sp. 511 TaxID=2302930 RepID=UPI002105C823|nr:hypothetical protein [Dysgonomonas sp. 511]
MERKITIMGVLQEGISIGLQNAASVLIAIILWLVTIWIPYLNVGTTIAISSIPIALSKGQIISPFFIFDAKYRQYMGEYFTLLGLMYIALVPAMLFLIVPAIIISIGWSLAVYILIDKEVAPGEALIQSNKATNGYKWTIFGVSFILIVVLFILTTIFGLLGSTIGAIMTIVLLVLFMLIILGCNTVIYRNLVLKNNDDNNVTEEPASTESPVSPIYTK